MINANELRLGNLVGFYRPLLTELQTGHIAGITETHVGVPEFSQMVSLSPNGITGIPLTEEWLLKFGFQQQGEVFVGYEENLTYPYYYFTDFGIALVGDIYRLWINCEDEWCSFPWTKITYVHQLQNLYFALTGEELILKT